MYIPEWVIVAVLIGAGIYADSKRSGPNLWLISCEIVAFLAALVIVGMWFIHYLTH